MTTPELFDASGYQVQAEPGRLDFPDDALAEARILQAFETATPEELESGLAWYFEAHEICQNWFKRYEVASADHVAGIIAALSPMSSWSGNIVAARRLLETSQTAGLGYAVRDAKRIHQGESPVDVLYEPGRNNTKVRSFYRNISDPESPDYVTFDRHMIGLLTDNPAALSIQRWVLPRHHHWATERFKSVAKEVALIPHQVQAVTWLAWRRDQGIVETQHTGQQSFFDIAV